MDSSGVLRNWDITNVVTYAYDKDNRLTTMVDSAGTTAYGYANGLLASENGPWANTTR
jgi:YD repeat-containing protein